MQHITWSVQYNNSLIVISGISYDNILSDTHTVRVPAGVVPCCTDIACLESWLYECDARVGDTRTLDGITYRLIDKNHRVLPDPPAGVRTADQEAHDQEEDEHLHGESSVVVVVGRRQSLRRRRSRLGMLVRYWFSTTPRFGVGSVASRACSNCAIEVDR